MKLYESAFKHVLLESKGKSKKRKSYSAKKAAEGKDIGKPGKQFGKIAKKAGKKYGSKKAGEKVAGAVLGKLRKKYGESHRKSGKMLTEAPVMASPEEQMSDADVWAGNNENIAGNEELSGKFDVQGIPAEVHQQYAENIAGWVQEVNQMADTLEQIYDLATKSAEKPGADSIFNETGKIVEELLSNIGTLQGKLKYLGKKVNVLIARDAKKQRGL